MAVSVNTDLIMGVINAAQPSAIAQADAKLNAKSVSKIEIAAAGDEFAKQLLNTQTQALPQKICPICVQTLINQIKPMRTKSLKRWCFINLSNTCCPAIPV